MVFTCRYPIPSSASVSSTPSELLPRWRWRGDTSSPARAKWLGLSGKYGYLGVDIFFVISGFVIPWSLYRTRYAIRDYPRFLLKRNVRLYPPYLASIAISILATNFILVPLFKIPHMTVTGRDLLLHFRLPERSFQGQVGERRLLDAGRLNFSGTCLWDW